MEADGPAGPAFGCGLGWQPAKRKTLSDVAAARANTNIRWAVVLIVCFSQVGKDAARRLKVEFVALGAAGGIAVCSWRTSAQFVILRYSEGPLVHRATVV